MLTNSAGSSKWKECNKVTILRINSSQFYGTLCRTSHSKTSLSTNDSIFRETNIAARKNRVRQIKR